LSWVCSWFFSCSLAAGCRSGEPLGEASTRFYRLGLRWASLAAAGVLGLAGWVVLGRAGNVAPGPEPIAIRAETSHPVRTLVSALSLVIGWEALVVLADVRGLARAAQLEVVAWSARAMVRAALSAAPQDAAPT
jgi:hypothetical protein